MNLIHQLDGDPPFFGFPVDLHFARFAAPEVICRSTLSLGRVTVTIVRIAFKEWAVVVDALGHGEQIVILRKGGISEERGGFRVDHPEFLFFPTLFHQQREQVIPSAQARYDVLAPTLPPKEKLRLEYFARVIAWQRLDSAAAATRLCGQHIWREEVIAERFDWGRQKNIHALAVRVFRLPQKVELPMLEEYGGCKSWIELAKDIGTEDAIPVLDEATFAQKLGQFTAAVGMAPAAPVAT